MMSLRKKLVRLAALSMVAFLALYVNAAGATARSLRPGYCEYENMFYNYWCFSVQQDESGWTDDIQLNYKCTTNMLLLDPTAWCTDCIIWFGGECDLQAVDFETGDTVTWHMPWFKNYTDPQ
jgi:hypothetical protein